MQTTTLFSEQPQTEVKKENKKTYINLDDITLTPTAYAAWRETEYLQRQKMYNRFKDLTFEEYTEPQLCIIEKADTKELFYYVFVAARNFKTRLQITEDDWCLGKVEEDAIGSYYKDSIHNFKVFAASKEDAHYRIYKECAKNGLLVPIIMYYEDTINRFNIHAASQEEAHEGISKAYTKRGLTPPLLQQIKLKEKIITIQAVAYRHAIKKTWFVVESNFPLFSDCDMVYDLTLEETDKSLYTQSNYPQEGDIVCHKNGKYYKVLESFWKNVMIPSLHPHCRI